MKRNLLLTLCALFGMGAAWGQSFAPVGAEWHYDYKMNNATGYLKVSSVGDTLIDGTVCKKLAKTLYYTLYYYTQDNVLYQDNFSQELVPEYLAQFNDSIMLYRDGSFKLLFDFGADVGDFWEIPYPQYNSDVCYDNGKVEVVGNGTEIINGHELRYVSLKNVEGSSWGYNYYGNSETKVVEKVGPVNDYLFPESFCMVDEYEGGLPRCYSDNEIGMIRLSEVECEDMDGFYEAGPDSMFIYPNPTTGLLKIKNGSETIKSIEVVDNKGSVCYSREGTSSQEHECVIDLTNLPNGIYCIIINNDINFSRKIIKFEKQ